MELKGPMSEVSRKPLLPLGLVTNTGAGVTRVSELELLREGFPSRCGAPEETKLLLECLLKHGMRGVPGLFPFSGVLLRPPIG